MTAPPRCARESHPGHSGRARVTRAWESQAVTRAGRPLTEQARSSQHGQRVHTQPHTHTHTQTHTHTHTHTHKRRVAKAPPGPTHPVGACHRLGDVTRPHNQFLALTLRPPVARASETARGAPLHRIRTWRPPNALALAPRPPPPAPPSPPRAPARTAAPQTPSSASARSPRPSVTRRSGITASRVRLLRRHRSSSWRACRSAGSSPATRSRSCGQTRRRSPAPGACQRRETERCCRQHQGRAGWGPAPVAAACVSL